MSRVGKSTLARQLADQHDLDFVELDSIFHQANWTQLPQDDFQSELRERLDAGRWVVDGTYIDPVGREVVAPEVDKVIWLDLPKFVAASRVLLRTVRRGVKRETLWNGNRERLRNLLSLSPDKNLVLSVFGEHGVRRRQIEALIDSGALDHASVIRLRSAAEAAERFPQ